MAQAVERPYLYARQRIARLIDLYRSLDETARKTTSEAGVVHQFVNPLLDALVAHLYGLSRDEFAHILGAFPLVFPANVAGQQRKAALLGVYEGIAAGIHQK